MTILALLLALASPAAAQCGAGYASVAGGTICVLQSPFVASDSTGAVVAVTSTSMAVGIPLPEDGVVNGGLYTSGTFIGVATTTAYGLRGGHPTLYLWVVTAANNSAQVRWVTCRMFENGVALAASTRTNGIAAANDSAVMSGHTMIPASTAGTSVLSLRCNATGALCTASTPHLSLMEF